MNEVKNPNLSKAQLLRLIFEYKKAKKYYQIFEMNNQFRLCYDKDNQICDELIALIDELNIHPIEWEILCTDLKSLNKTSQKKYAKEFAILFDKYDATCHHCKKELNINDVKFLARYGNELLFDCPECNEPVIARDPALYRN